MIKCLIDMCVPEDSKCSKCCLYCQEKQSCMYLCDLIKSLQYENIAEAENIVGDQCATCDWE